MEHPKDNTRVASIGLHPGWMAVGAAVRHPDHGPCRVSAICGVTRLVHFVSCTAVPTGELAADVLQEMVYEVQERQCDASQLRWLAVPAIDVAPVSGSLLDFVIKKQEHIHHVEPSGQLMRKNS